MRSIDHNGLNNTKANPHLYTAAQNRVPIGGSSKFKSVCCHRQARKWQAYIKHRGILIYPGLFTSELAAAMAYDDKAVELFGEFACVNLPERIEIKQWIHRLIYGRRELRQFSNPHRISMCGAV